MMSGGLEVRELVGWLRASGYVLVRIFLVSMRGWSAISKVLLSGLMLLPDIGLGRMPADQVEARVDSSVAADVGGSVSGGVREMSESMSQNIRGEEGAFGLSMLPSGGNKNRVEGNRKPLILGC